ncbi:transferase [Cryptococcus gattii Ru294]|uniref:Transferase, putative n=2 Tax=Cryptococcus gattii TaxID=37769 RepID=E6R6B5_CRYGW|nr:Transferase, putative [Cryptococcus gattii WM276]KIR56413.1 transferase [Cryptococcus gattii Ru294]KIR78683.1 transferase [Cryptococcus gattii EJB2]KIY34509.1 transferase [Cryptococcus gattii E566]KJD99714.1 transferase [Cryptococcus gattii NT-10]ADV22258.1 Transferase, putative [Cryptococcus gattii WM276]
MSHLPTEVPMLRLSYNDIHKAIQDTAVEIKKEFAPTLFIAIGGGGFIPARILRTQLKNDVNGKKRNIPIQAVGLVLYEDMGGVEEKVGAEVVRTQWLDFSTLGDNFTHGGLLGRRILIVDEVDDTRTTLMYLVKELQRDINKQLEDVKDEVERERLRAETKLGVFVVHNKLKPKAGTLPDDVAYFSAVDTPDVWLAYPWECDGDIDAHDALRSDNPKI